MDGDEASSLEFLADSVLDDFERILIAMESAPIIALAA
jgi:hypothetical protein